MNRFSYVRITPDKCGGDIIPVTIAVSSGARHETTLGGGFGIDPLDYEVRLRAGYTISGWPAPAVDSAGVDLRTAYSLLRADSSYEPRIRALATTQRMDLLASVRHGARSRPATTTSSSRRTRRTAPSRSSASRRRSARTA